MSFFANLSYRNKNQKNSYQKLQKRSLRLETLEERQLLTVAMDMALGAGVPDSLLDDTAVVASAAGDEGGESTTPLEIRWSGDNETPGTVVSTLNDSDNEQDDSISLREAVDYAGNSYSWGWGNNRQTVNCDVIVTFNSALANANGEINLTLNNSLNIVKTGVEIQAAANQKITINLGAGVAFSGTLTAADGGWIDVVNSEGKRIASTDETRLIETPSTAVTILTDTADTAEDSGISLREAVGYAEDGDTITFNVETDSTISIGSELNVGEKGLTFDVGAKDITIQLTAGTDFFSAPITVDTADGGSLVLKNADGTVAFSTKWETPATTVTTTLSGVNKTDGKISLQEAIEYAGKTHFNPEGNVTLPAISQIDLTAANLGVLPEGKTDYVFEISDIIALEDDLTINADGISVVLKFVGNGDIDEKFGVLSLTAENSGRIRIIDAMDETLYDSAWEFRGMNSQTIINVADDQLDNFDKTDGNISLREAISYIGLEYREYAQGNTDVTLGSNLVFDESLADETFQMESMLDLNGPLTLDGSGIKFNGAQIQNNGELTLKNVTFTGTYNLNQQNNYNGDENGDDNQPMPTLVRDGFYLSDTNAIVSNVGEDSFLYLQGCTFSNIDLNYEISQYEDQDEQGIYGDFALVYNSNGEIFVEECAFTNNTLDLDAVHGDIFASFAAIKTEGDGNRGNGLTIISRTEISNNSIDAFSKHGNVSANMYGIYDNNAQLAVFSSIIYGQTAEADSKYGNVGTEGEEIIEPNATGIFAETEDILLLNSTILDTISLNRSEAVVLNTMYNETEFVRSGFRDSDADGHNIDLTKANWSTIFPYWNADTKTFSDNAGKYKIYADSAAVDKGSNDFLTVEYMGNLFREELDEIEFMATLQNDLLGNDRIIHTTVDIGAVESDAVRLDAQTLNPTAKAQKDEAGLTTIDFSWGSDAIESDRVTFNVRYKLASADGKIADNWTTLTDVGQGASLPAGVAYDAATSRYTWTVTDLTAGKVNYNFEVFGIGDRIDYVDSADWVGTAENTREQLLEPEYEQAAPQSETAITITWVTDPRAVAYEIVYAKNETPEATTTKLVLHGEGGVTIQEKEIAGETVSGAAYTIEGLEEGVGYTIQWRALSEYGFSVIEKDNPTHGDDYLLNSEWVTKTTSTKTVLSAPSISNEFTNTLTTLNISWTQGDPGTSSYTVEMETEDPTSSAWTASRTFTTSNTSLLVSGLQPATQYSFRVKATGNTQLYVDSDWSVIKSFTTLTQLANPTLTAASKFTDEFTTDTLKVDWTAPAEATNSVLTMSEDGVTYKEMTPENFANATFATTDNSVVISGLTAGKEYFFKIVCSADPKVYAPSEATASATTPTAVATPVLSWSDNSNGTANISWAAIANSTEYVVKGTAQNETQFTTGTIGTETTSTFDVYARGNQADNYASSKTATQTLQRLTAPANVAATTPEDGTTTINVSWSAVVNSFVSGYKVQYLSGDNWIDAGTTAADATSLLVGALTPGTEYFFRVQTLSVSGNEGGMLISEYSDGAAKATTLKAPYAPTALTADANGLHTAALTWTPDEGADETYSYTINAYLASDDSFVKTVANVTETTCTVDGLAENTKYYFTITAYSTDPQYLGGSQAVKSNEDTTWIQLVTPNLSVADGGVGLSSVILNWADTNEVADVANYEITYGATPADTTTITVDAGTFTKTIEGLAQGTEYTFTIVAKGKADRSVDSLPDTTDQTDSVTATTWAELDKSAEVAAVATSTTTITVTWDAVENADFGYDVTCDTIPAGAEIVVDNENLSATVTGLAPNTEYTFDVVANGGKDATSGITYVDGGSNSDSATTWQKLSISTFTATVNGTEITLNWTVPEGDEAFTEKYVVERKVGQDWVSVPVSAAAGMTATFDGEPGTAYQFRVMADSNQGDDGNSAWKDLAGVSTWEKLDVENFTATPESTTKIELGWDALNAPGVEYFVYVAQGLQEEFSDGWDTVDATDLVIDNGRISLLVTGLNADTTYTFAIYAAAEKYIQSDVDLANAKTNAIVPLTDNLVIDATAAGQTITVEWPPVTGAVSYNVAYSWTGIDGTARTDSKTVTTDQAVFPNLEPGVKYTFTVTATPAASDVDHSPAVSNEDSATTDALKLTVPNGTAVANNSGLSVRWDAVDNASGYQIQWRVADSTGDWTSAEVGSSVVAYTIANVTASTEYEIQIIALGDDTHYTDSDPADLDCKALIAVELDAVVVLDKSDSTATEKPESVAQIDEWTPAYLELWTDDVQGLVNGRELSATFTINDNFEAKSVQDLPGTTVVIDGNTIQITIDMDYTGYAGGASAIVAQILLTPKSQANGNTAGNGIGVEDESDKLVQYNNVWITDIVPVIYDLDDNGAIDSIDEALYAAYTKKDPAVVDYNKDDKNCDDDLRMLTRNKGKSQAGDWAVDYSKIDCTCGNPVVDPDPTPAEDPTPAPALAAAASGFVSTMYVEEESDVVITEASSEISIELAKMEKDLMPFQQEENRMTDGTVLKKTVKTDKDSDVQADENDSASDVEVNLDQFWADEQNADWRFA